MRNHSRIVLLALALAATVHAADEPLARGVDLPKQADRLRKAGVPPAEVAEAIRATKGKGVSAADAADVLDDSADASEENGPIDNFGKFVNEKLDEGLRGRELAEAIHQEHEARGKGPKDGKGGKGKGRGKAGGPDDGDGEDDGEHGDGEEHGKPDDKGGKPDDKGGGGGGGGGGKGGKGGKSKGGH